MSIKDQENTKYRRKTDAERDAFWLDGSGNKRCCTCKRYVPLADYHKCKGNAYGLSYSCKKCAIANSRKHHKRRMDTIPAYREAKREAYRKSAWGMTNAEYVSKRDSQDGCAICGVSFAGRGPYFAHLDHNHATGKIRDFLCTNCNRGIGHLKESLDILQKAISYLERHNEQVSDSK